MINTFQTIFEARELKFQQERLFRGESVDLVARITTDGIPDSLSDYQISGVYQPVGDDPEGLTYSVDAEISDGKAILHWTDENDFGKTAYNVWGLLTKDGKGAYPIAWRLNFVSSPSYPIDEINPLVRTIDFDNYDLLNAPWVPLSGGNMEEDAEIGFPISGDSYFTVSKDGFKKVDETTVETEAMSGYCWHELPDPVPEYEIQWVTESEIADWDPSTQGTPPWQDPRYRLCGTKPAESHVEKTVVASFSVPSDEEGEHTFATREWTQDELSDYPTKTEADGKYVALSGGNITMDFNLKCVGFNVLSGLNGAIAIGTASSSTGFSTVVGHHAKADARYSVVLGNEAKSTAQNGVAIGDSAQALSVDSTAVGALSYATKANSLALGKSAKANASKAIQLGIGVNALENSLQVFDKNVLSGSNLTLNPDRIPYLSEYAKQTDLSDYATEDWVVQYVDEHGGGASGDYLPLSGGVISGDFGVLNRLDLTGSGVALGRDTEKALASIAIGFKAKALQTGSLAIGNNAKSEKTSSIALGNSTQATKSRAVAVGYAVSSDGWMGIGLGYSAHIGENGECAVQIGEGTNDSPSCLNYLSANIIEPLSGNLAINPDRLPYLADYATKEFVQSEISDFVTEDALTGLATKEEVQAVDDKLSGYAEKEELTAYATETYVQEYVDQHAASGDYLPLSGGTVDGPFLAKNFISADYIGDKVGTIAIGSGISAEVSAHTGAAALDPSGPILIGNNTAVKQISQWTKTGAGIAIGNNSIAYGEGIAIGGDRAMGGYSAISQGHSIATQSSIAIGKEALAGAYYDSTTPTNPQLITTLYAYSVAIGNMANALSSNDVAVGANAKTSETNSVAIGYSANANKSGSIVIGSYVRNVPTADGLSSIVIGADAVSNGDRSIIIGPKATTVGGAYQFNAIGIGNEVSATMNAVAIGSHAATLSSTNDTGGDGIAIGNYAKTTRYGAIQLGRGTNSKPCSLQIGDTTILSSTSDWSYSNLKLNPAVMPNGYATESYVDTKIGDINSILDSINGQTI